MKHLFLCLLQRSRFECGSVTVLWRSFRAAELGTYSAVSIRTHFRVAAETSLQGQFRCRTVSAPAVELACAQQYYS